MKKLLLLILLASIGGFIYSPYKLTEDFATAVVNRDLTTLAAATDTPKFREAFKAGIRGMLSDTLRQHQPSNYPLQRARSELLAAIVLHEKQIDLLFTEEQTGRMFDLIHTKEVRSSYHFTNKGWRGPLTFVAVDNNDGTKMVFEFQGLAGWRLTGFDVSRNVASTLVGNLLRSSSR
ncbi:MAG: hypothetical protein RL088_2515 [Verrucomicrobiota bacterium]